MKKHIISLFLCLFVAMQSTMCFAADIETNYNGKLMEKEELVNKYHNEVDTEYTISYMLPLKSFADDEMEYTFCKLNPSGHVVFHEQTGEIMELCYYDVDLVSTLKDNDIYYYAGPGNYFLKGKENYVSLKNNVELTQEEVANFKKQENLMTLERNNIESSSSYAMESSNRYYMIKPEYFSTLAQFGTNSEGTCTVLAECILLGYYDEYINDNYVYSSYKDGKGTNEAFHQYMIGLVYGSNEITGKFIRDTVPAVDGYLRRQATQSTLHAVYSSAPVARTQIMDKIIAGYPVVASMGTNYGAKWNHTVVVYGLEGDLFRVHMGWHGTGYYSYYVNLSYFYECGFI